MKSILQKKTINTQANYHLIIIKVQKKTRLFVSKKKGFGYSPWQTQLDVFKRRASTISEVFFLLITFYPLTVPNLFGNHVVTSM